MTTDGDTSANNVDACDEEVILKYEKKSKWQQCCEFLYDKKTGQICGRTGTSWVQIIVFYIVFYAFLAGFFGTCLYVFMETLDYNTPKFYGKGSILGHNPGMGYQPWLSDDPESTLIHINKTEPESYQKYIEQLKKFLKRYENTDHTRLCTGDESNGEEGKDACRVDIEAQLRNTGCTAENDFGYKAGKPCVFLTLNRVIGWRPLPYPRNSAPDVVKFRHDHDKKGSISIDCSGEYLGDKENIGKRTYIPEEGISWRYYPYKKMPNYHQPFAVVQFENLPMGTLVEVECHAYAYNIVQDQNDRLGMVHFELLYDDASGMKRT